MTLETLNVVDCSPLNYTPIHFTHKILAILPAYIAPKCLMVICKYSGNTDGVNKLYGIETADPVLSSLDTGDMWYRNSKMSSTKCHPSLIINILIDCRKHYLPCSRDAIPGVVENLILLNCSILNNSNNSGLLCCGVVVWVIASITPTKAYCVNTVPNSGNNVRSPPPLTRSTWSRVTCPPAGLLTVDGCCASASPAAAQLRLPGFHLEVTSHSTAGSRTVESFHSKVLIRFCKNDMLQWKQTFLMH